MRILTVDNQQCNIKISSRYDVLRTRFHSSGFEHGGVGSDGIGCYPMVTVLDATDVSFCGHRNMKWCRNFVNGGSASPSGVICFHALCRIFVDKVCSKRWFHVVVHESEGRMLWCLCRC